MINRRGFTLVEVIVIIVVIAILATIASLGLNRYLEDGRDTQRTSSITTIQEALEKYYNVNGEYPSCGAITANGATVSTNTLKGIDQASLIVPSASSSTTNSIRCGTTLTPGGTAGDFIQYVGDGSPDCTGNGSCLSYTLRYRNEAKNTVVEVQSRHTVDIATSGGGDLKATTTGFTTANVNWKTTNNVVNYTLQRSTSDDFSTSLVNATYSGTSTGITGLTSGTEYFFRVRGNGTAQTGEWSNTATIRTLELGDLDLTATVNSATQITTNWTVPDNANGTTTYTIQRATNIGFTTGLSTVSGITGTSRVWTGLTAGETYFFRVQAVATGDTSDWSNVTSSSTVPPAPTGVTATVNSATQYRIAWNAASGAASYVIRYGTTSSANSYSTTTTSTSINISTSILQGTTHYFKVYSRASSGVESPASATVSGTTPINAPAAFSITKSTSSTAITSAATSASCPSGTTRYYLWKANGTTWVQGTTRGSVTYNLNPGQSVTLTGHVKCQKGSVNSAYRNSSNSVSHSRPGMNLSLSLGSDGCSYGFCGRTVYSSWNAVCGSVRPTISAQQLSARASWTADSTTGDEIKWKGASSPGVVVSYSVPLGCTTGSASIRVISAYKCTGCS